MKGVIPFCEADQERLHAHVCNVYLAYGFGGPFREGHDSVLLVTKTLEGHTIVRRGREELRTELPEACRLAERAFPGFIHCVMSWSDRVVQLQIQITTSAGDSRLN